MNEQINEVVAEEGLDVPAFLKRSEAGEVIAVQTEDEVGKEVLAQEGEAVVLN